MEREVFTQRLLNCQDAFYRDPAEGVAALVWLTVRVARACGVKRAGWLEICAAAAKQAGMPE